MVVQQLVQGLEAALHGSPCAVGQGIDQPGGGRQPLCRRPRQLGSQLVEALTGRRQARLVTNLLQQLQQRRLGRRQAGELLGGLPGVFSFTQANLP